MRVGLYIRTMDAYTVKKIPKQSRSVDSSFCLIFWTTLSYRWGTFKIQMRLPHLFRYFNAFAWISSVGRVHPVLAKNQILDVSRFEISATLGWQLRVV